MDLVQKLVDLKIHILAIKDMAGVCVLGSPAVLKCVLLT
jgi:pyruvate carboxylase